MWRVKMMFPFAGWLYWLQDREEQRKKDAESKKADKSPDYYAGYNDGYAAGVSKTKMMYRDWED